MGNNQGSKNKNKPHVKRMITKFQLELALKKAKEFTILARDRRQTTVRNKEKALLMAIGQFNRQQKDEYIKGTSIVTDVCFINACGITLRYIEILLDKSINIIESRGDHQRITQLLDYIISVLWAGKPLNIPAYGDLYNLLYGFFGPGVEVCVKSEHRVDAELKAQFENLMPQPQEVNAYFRKFCDKYRIDIQKFNACGHQVVALQPNGGAFGHQQVPNYPGVRQQQGGFNPMNQQPHNGGHMGGGMAQPMNPGMNPGGGMPMVPNLGGQQAPGPGLGMQNPAIPGVFGQNTAPPQQPNNNFGGNMGGGMPNNGMGGGNLGPGGFGNPSGNQGAPFGGNPLPQGPTPSNNPGPGNPGNMQPMGGMGMGNNGGGSNFNQMSEDDILNQFSPKVPTQQPLAKAPMPGAQGGQNGGNNGFGNMGVPPPPPQNSVPNPYSDVGQFGYQQPGGGSNNSYQPTMPPQGPGNGGMPGNGMPGNGMGGNNNDNFPPPDLL